MLKARFGPLSLPVQIMLEDAPADLLNQWAKNFVHADSLDAVFRTE